MTDAQRHQRKLYMRRYRMTAVQKVSKEYQAAYYQANKDKSKERSRKYHEENREEILARHRGYRDE